MAAPWPHETTLARRDLKPFEGAIQAAVPMVMTGHLRVPALDPTGILNPGRLYSGF